MTIHKDFLQRQSRSGKTVVAAVADNCRFDERTGDARWEQFDAILSRMTAGPDVSDWRDWAEANQLYLDLHCNVATPTDPDAFLPINRDAWLDGLAENQSVVRIEALTRPLQTSAISLPCTLHLSPDKADTLTAEIVHCRIDYKREHLRRLGRITRPHSLHGDDKLREARDLHLLALQEECGRDDFGEPFEGRT